MNPPHNQSTFAIPAAAGYSMPAEWELHAATWIGWPHNASDWPGKLPAVQWAYGEIVRHLVPGEIVRILVNSPSYEQGARELLQRVGVDLSRVEFFRVPTNRGWTRDFGPMFVAWRAGGVNSPMGTSEDLRPPLAIARFGFNAWAKYPDWQFDARVAGVLAERLGVLAFPVQHLGRDVVLEGGAIDVNGAGTLITTEECLLDQQVQVRNPGLTRADMEAVLKDSLGVRNVIWLGRGIVGDDTHGHVDDLCRFVNKDTVVLAQEPDRQDPNHHILAANRERLEDARLEDGSRLNIARLPMPSPLFFDGIRLPASYANFYIANAAVLVPTFNDPRDREALGILAELFPDRPVIGIHAVDLVWGLGTLHCLTQQEPIGEGVGSSGSQAIP
ncbi:MAG: agmatine/peptidylarginine deiminase [Planctomycetaceae bacterium]